MMPLSQRLIHTRVYGQALAIGITAVIVSYTKQMEEQGAYCMHEGRVAREAEVGGRQLQWYETEEYKHKLVARVLSLGPNARPMVETRALQWRPVALLSGLSAFYARIRELSAHLLSGLQLRLQSYARVYLGVLR